MPLFLNILEYFFDPLPPGQFKFVVVFIVIAAIGFVVSSALMFYLKQQKNDKIFKKLFRNLPGKLLTIAVMEGVYVIARYERMPYVSMRFLNYIVLAYGLYVVIHYAQLYLKVYPADKKHREHQLKKNKYLPRKNNKKR